MSCRWSGHNGHRGGCAENLVQGANFHRIAERKRKIEMISANTRCLMFVSVFSFLRFISIFSLFESNLFRWPSVPFSSPYIIFSKFSTQLRPIVDETPKASRPLQPPAISALNESLHSTSQDVFCLEQFRARTARRKPFDFVFLAEQWLSLQFDASWCLTSSKSMSLFWNWRFGDDVCACIVIFPLDIPSSAKRFLHLWNDSKSKLMSIFDAQDGCSCKHHA